MDHTGRFEGTSARYADFRPDYPATLLRWLAGAIVDPPSPQDGWVVDVGSGTGIFTRQLVKALPRGLHVMGVEPSADMRGKAQGHEGARHIDGKAESLPLGDAEARAVTAATAAHWFDRPPFYAEAARVLKPGGLLAIVEYVRDENSPAAALVIDFLARHGGPRAYGRPDYDGELRRAPGFADFDCTGERLTLHLAPQAFAGLALSSSHARAAIDRFGYDEAARMLVAEAGPLLSGEGLVPFGYLFQAFTARRV